MLQELTQKLQDEHGITPEQSTGVVNSVVQFIKEKFPMIGGSLDHLLGTTTNSEQVSLNPSVNESTFDKAKDFAEEKLGGIFGGSK